MITAKYDKLPKNKMMRVLILCTSQFGYHLDTYYYCKYAHEMLEITYLGFEGTRRQLPMKGVHVKKVSYKGNKIRRWFRWVWAALSESSKEYDVVFVKYFPGCAIVKIVASERTFVLDVRTGAIEQRPWRRALLDFILRCESFVFQNITVISTGLAEKLKLPPNKIHLLPLGADPIACAPKRFERIDLLYLGTFSGRDLEKTIIGFARFYHEKKKDISMTFTLVGDGYSCEREKLQRLATELGLEGSVNLPGFIHHKDLNEYWMRSNVGVSFIPINDIYDAQPPTKTFEYILAGMPVIATSTTANKHIINDVNGTLIADTSDGFYMGLKEILRNRTKYHSDRIRATCANFHWAKIVKENLYPYWVKINKANHIVKQISNSEN